MDESYQYKIRQLTDSLRDITEVCQTLANEVNRLDDELMYLTAHQENYLYEISDPRHNNECAFPKVKGVDETIQEIIDHQLSVSRYGDGEFALMAGNQRHPFQAVNPMLAERLYEILHSNHPKLMIAVADNYGSLSAYNKPAADAIRLYMAHQGNRQIQTALLGTEREYGNAYLSRPYVLYKDNMTDGPRKRFERLKQIWKNRDVLIVEGAQTRIGVGNDLLDGAKTVRRILAPPTNAFDKYDEILSAALKYAEEGLLFLIALGPSAGVLAYDLTLAGYQAIDIGHVDLEYEWFFAGEGKRTPVPYKYNNELKGDQETIDINDPTYEAQILFSTEK